MPTKKKTPNFSAASLKRVFPESSAEELTGIANMLNRSSSLRSSLSRDRYIDPKLLALLASDTNRDVLVALASNPSTPPAVLKRLAKDKKLQYSLAWNPSTPDDILGKLASNSDEGVRMAVASNPSTPFGTMQRLAKDKKPYIREHAMFRLDVRSGRRKLFP